MSTYTFAEKINLSTVMISGLKNNMERVAKRGINSDFIPELEAKLESIKATNNEQESLKAKLKTKTQDLNIQVDDMMEMINEAKKVVKLEFDSSEWKEFGVLDKR